MTAMSPFRASAAALLGGLTLAACGTAPTDAVCDAFGTGNLVVNITDVPAGLTPEITVIGPGGSTVLTASATLGGQPVGGYQFTAKTLFGVDTTVVTAFAGDTPDGEVCLNDGATRTVTIAYGPVPTSGKVWVGAGFYALGFTSAQVGATATMAPTVTAATRGGAGLTFDREGNLWVRGQSSLEPDLMRFPASSLIGTVSPTPDRTIELSGLACDGVGSLAFDEGGNLWVSLGCAQRVVRVSAAQLEASGTVIPTVQISNLVRPEGLAFDDGGNLWVADDAQLRRFDAARLGANITTAADLSVTFTTPSPPAPGQTALRAHHLAWTEGGELWVGSYEQQALYRVEAGTIALTGAQAATPTRIVYLPAAASPQGFAFDESGGLIVGYTLSTFARLSPTQLTVNSTPGAPTIPAKLFASGNILGFAQQVTLYPAPAGTPLFHRVR